MRKTAKLLSAVWVLGCVAMPVEAGPRHQSAIGCAACLRSGNLEGKWVIGLNGGILGYVLAANDRSRLAELQTVGGIAVSLPEARLLAMCGMIYAPTLGQRQVLAMEEHQTGRTEATNIDLRHDKFRG